MARSLLTATMVALAWASQAAAAIAAVDAAPLDDEPAWQRELGRAIATGAFGDERAAAAELLAKLTQLQHRGGGAEQQSQRGQQSCRFPGGPAQPRDMPAAMRMDSTCSGSLSIASLQVETPRLPRYQGESASPLYADTRTVMYDMSPESRFAEAAAVKVATVAGV